MPNAVLLAYYYSLYKYSDMLWTRPALSLITFAPFFCLSISRLIVSTVSKTKFTLFKNIHLSIPIIVSILIFPINKHMNLQLNESYVYAVLIFANFYAYFFFVFNAINQISQYLGIYCLTIKPK